MPYLNVGINLKMKRLTFILTLSFTSIISVAQDLVDDQYMNAYIVVADTSQDYIELREKMFDLSDKLKLEIDTMGRGYSKTKKLISLPDNHDDEIYAGDYFPRRYPTETLSLEYLEYYTEGVNPTEGTIALILTITDNQEIASTTLKRVQQYTESAYIINTRIYMGCMH